LIVGIHVLRKSCSMMYVIPAIVFISVKVILHAMTAELQCKHVIYQFTLSTLFLILRDVEKKAAYNIYDG